MIHTLYNFFSLGPVVIEILKQKSVHMPEFSNKIYTFFKGMQIVHKPVMHRKLHCYQLSVPSSIHKNNGNNIYSHFDMDLQFLPVN